MRHRGLLVVATAMCLLAACTSRTAPEPELEREPVTSVVLDVDSGGSVSVEGDADVEDATVSVRYDGDAPEEHTYEIEDGVLTLHGCGPRCAVDYTVKVPERVPVSGKVQSGAVTLSRVNDIDVASDNGEITLTSIEEGRVVVRSNNGSIRGVDLSTEHVDAVTKNGEIEIQVATPQNIRAQTENGAIRLTVPEDEYRLSVDNPNGPVDIGVENDPEGTHHLDLRSRNGAITVRTT